MAMDDVEVRLVCPALGDKAEIQRLRGHEQISELFDFELLVVVPVSDEVDAGEAVGSDADVVFVHGGVESRTIRGMVAELDDLGDTEAKTRRFRVKLVPKAYRLTFVQTQEVYLDLSVPEIVAQKLELVGLADSLELRLSASYPKKEFVTQYKESDLAFISRLLEHEGISFFFEQDGTKDRLVLTDHNGGFSAAGDPIELHARGEHSHVFELSAEHRLTPAMYVVQDYNYRRSMLDLTSDAAVEGGFAGGVVEYGSHHKTADEGQALAKVRAEETRARQLVYAGKSGKPGLAAGGRASIHGHARFGDLDLVVVRVEHSASQVALGAGEKVERYTESFRAMPGDRPFRPARATPKPRIYGVVSGIVDDASRNVDKYSQLDDSGRYVVRLLYDTVDREGKLASRWIRMAQPHVGADYGMHFPLKPGVEVLLAFIDGDPDRPIIVGAVHNAATPSPVDVKNNTLNRLKSASGVIIEYGDRRLSTK